jgi:hypothetical protein
MVAGNNDSTSVPDMMADLLFQPRYSSMIQGGERLIKNP